MNAPTILIATWADGLFAVNGDQGAHELRNVPVRGLATDGHGGALAIVHGHSLQRRAPDGLWSLLATSDFDLSCCLTVGETIYVGTDDARLLRLNPAAALLEPLESFNHVAGRETWFAGSAIVNGQRLGPPLGIRSLSANANGSVLFANVHVGGIPRSLDGGKTWYPTLDIHTDVHEVRAHPSDPSIVAAASAGGLCLSRDAGATWSITSDGLHAPHCSAVAFAGENLLLSASVDPFVPQGKVYRYSLESKGPLEAIANGLPAWTAGKVDTACIATAGASIAMVDSGGNLYRSTDSGQSWAQHRGGFPAPSAVLIA